MNKEYVEIFPTLIMHLDSFLSQEECDKIMSIVDVSKCKAHEALIGDSGSYYSDGIINNSKFLNEIDLSININNRIASVVDEYSREVGYSELRITNSWYNIQRKNSTLAFHSHPESVVSGALYIKTDSDSSMLNFQNPNNHIGFSKYKHVTKYSSEYYNFIPSNGKLILFPSWLKHGSYHRNMSDERVVISFNTINKYMMQD
jgi:uncharacterized protein (TIGR02466 family)